MFRLIHRLTRTDTPDAITRHDAETPETPDTREAPRNRFLARKPSRRWGRRRDAFRLAEQAVLHLDGLLSTDDSAALIEEVRTRPEAAAVVEQTLRDELLLRELFKHPVKA